MDWQVYLHKTVIAAEQMLVKILDRARELASTGTQLFATPTFKHFLYNTVSINDFINENQHINNFVKLDDSDIMASIKVWCQHSDFILSKLCTNLIERQLYKVEITVGIPDFEKIESLKQKISKKLNITYKESSYFIFTDYINNIAYNTGQGNINVLMKNGDLQDITTASDYSNLEALAKSVTKNILCYTKV